VKLKPLVIYHDNCADGFGAAFAAWLQLGDAAEYRAFDYKTKVNAPDWIDLVDGREVYILDFSFPLPVMELTLAYAKHLVWLDHHKSAFEMWCGDYQRGMKVTQDMYIKDLAAMKCNIILDDNKSGAMLAWEYFHGIVDGTPLLFQHIDDYDRWQFKLDNTRAFNKALWSLAPWSFYQWNELMVSCCSMEGYHGFINEGAAIQRAHDQKVKAVIDYCARSVRIIPGLMHSSDTYHAPWVWGADDIVGATGLVANCPPDLASDVGHELAKRSGTFGMTWHQGKDKEIKVSIRSNGEYDVSAIAKAFGGGGHKNASGFHTNLDRIQYWISKGEEE
jgi:oligoribonuclease NrnB/cAMP/cGMP phosphodiesterase (DHH superfamily)